MCQFQHKPTLDTMTPAQHRVVLEHLLYTMNQEQRLNLIRTLPGLYMQIFPDCPKETVARLVAEPLPGSDTIG